MITIAAAALFFGLILFGLEMQYRCRSKERLEITSSDWHWQVHDPQKYWLTGSLELWNCSNEFEMVVSDLQIQVELLPKTTKPIVCQVQMLVDTGEEITQEIGYWETQIVQADRSRHLKVQLKFNQNVVKPGQIAHLQIHSVLYTRLGQVSQAQHLMVPMPLIPSLSVQHDQASGAFPIHSLS